MYIRSELTGSSSLDAAPVTRSHLFYAPVCCLAVYCAAEFSSMVLFGGTACIWLAGRGLFFRQVGISSVMAADSAAVPGGQAGITFDVELVIPWDAPEAVVDLNSDGLMDLEIVPDVIGLTGRRPEAAVCRILQGKDVRSVHVLVPDYLGLERNFQDVTIVDMGDLPEVNERLVSSPPTMADPSAPSYGVDATRPGYDACRGQKVVPKCPTGNVFLLQQMD